MSEIKYMSAYLAMQKREVDEFMELTNISNYLEAYNIWKDTNLAKKFHDHYLAHEPQIEEICEKCKEMCDYRCKKGVKEGCILATKKIHEILEDWEDIEEIIKNTCKQKGKNLDKSLEGNL